MAVFVGLVVATFLGIVAVGWLWTWRTNRKRLKDGFKTTSPMNWPYGGPRR